MTKTLEYDLISESNNDTMMTAQLGYKLILTSAAGLFLWQTEQIIRTMRGSIAFRPLVSSLLGQ